MDADLCSFWDEFVADDGAALWCYARKTSGDGRVDSKRLLEDGMEVFQTLDGFDVDFFVAAEGFADFVGQLGEVLWVAEEIVGGAGEQRGRSLLQGQ